MDHWSIADIPPQRGRLAVITGATGGLGYETALALAKAGAEVLVTGRNAEKGRIADQRIKRAVPSANVRFESLDLASLASIRAFAAKMKRNGQPLDLLVNNAGVMDLPTRRLTEDGFEMQFGTNHLSHFALTGLLLPLLRKAQAPRVVNVSSLAHRGGKIDFDNLQGERKYRLLGCLPAIEAGQSTVHLRAAAAQRCPWMGIDEQCRASRVRAYRSHSQWTRQRRSERIWRKVVGSFMSHSAAAGAVPTLFAATSPEAVPTATTAQTASMN